MKGKKKHQQPSFNDSVKESLKKAKDNTEDLVSFSFKYLNHDNEKFNFIAYREPEFYIYLLGKLRDISTMKMLDFLKEGEALRAHQIKWDSVSEDSFGIAGEEYIVDTPYQFEVATDWGRVHGFTIKNRFYIVWLDRHHKLYNNED